MQKEIEKFIKENIKKSGFFTGGISEEKVRKVEELLNVCLPKEYKWFLRKYGYGGVYGVLILGWGKSDKDIPIVEETVRFRRLGLPSNFIVIENCDEWVYCINCDDGRICMWSSWDPNFDYLYSDFYDFLINRFSSAKEGWD